MLLAGPLDPLTKKKEKKLFPTQLLSVLLRVTKQILGSLSNHIDDGDKNVTNLHV